MIKLSKNIRNLLHLFLLAGMVVVSLLKPGPAMADVVTVTRTDDVMEEGTLRWAVDQVNQAGSGTILFDESLGNETITLDHNNGHLEIEAKVYIDGNPLRHRPVTISGGDQVRVFKITESGNLTIDSLIITEGKADDDHGGGVYIYRGSLTVINCTIRNNSSWRGGGISNLEGNLIIQNSSIVENNSTTNGGGVAISGGKTTDIFNSTLSGNTANNRGGGISNQGAGDLNLEIRGSTISNNWAKRDGGGVFSNLGLLIVNSTLSGNTAERSGGGLFIERPIDIFYVAIFNSTIYGNRALGEDGGGGIFNSSISPAEFRISSTIIAGSDGGDCKANYFSINNYNLIEDGSCSSPTNLTGGPLLMPLEDNGGPTFTHALQPDSPARNAADPIACASWLVGGVDQRGVIRPQGGACDIGAFELEVNHLIYLPLILR